MPVRRLVQLLYPTACLLCRSRLSPPLRSAAHPVYARARAAAMFCGPCLAGLPASGPPVCLRCGLSLRGAFDAELLCRRCSLSPPAFAMARAPWRYAGRAKDAVRQHKYHGRFRIGRWLAATMVETARASMPLHEIAGVVPVPTHWLTSRLRGERSVEALARHVARALGKPYLPGALRRVRWTRTQTRLRAQARARNVRGAFAAREPLPQGGHLLLIDDVLTSGATANACARALLAAGAARVSVLAAARAPVA